MNFLNSSIALLLLVLSGCATVGPGQVGVLWHAFGGTEQTVYGEGKHAVAKWNKMYVYDLKTMTQDEPLSALTVDGLLLTMGTSLRYRLIPNDVLAVHKQVGQTYYLKIIKPSLLSEARRIFAQYTSEQIYSTKRGAIEREVRDALNAFVQGRYVAIEAFQIRDVDLPVAIRGAIDAKLVAEQQLFQTKYQLALAKAMADQKQVEARGIADYNNTVKASLNPPLLEFERVQGMSQLARSANAKTVVIGPSSGSHPVLVGTP